MSTRVAMIFGGRSVEHEVSVITAHQAMAAMPSDRYTVIPIYIAKSGQWYTGDVLRKLDNFRDLDRLASLAEPITFSPNSTTPGFLTQRVSKRGLFGGGTQLQFELIDVAFPLVHGSHGEDGTLQGLFELADIPYVGCDVAASAIGINKALTKRLLRAEGLPVVDDITISRGQWQQDRDALIKAIEERFDYPLYVKPARLGSSIGVSRAEDTMKLTFALDVALTYDNLVLIEPAQLNIIEINCSVLGDEVDCEASACEQPVSQGTLTYDDKYLRGGKSKGMKGSQRIIPADLPESMADSIRQAAMKAFRGIGGSGVARVDFLCRPTNGSFYVNEINTLPGSLSFYMWEASGVSFERLLDRLISIAQQRASAKKQSTYTFQSSLLGK